MKNEGSVIYPVDKYGNFETYNYVKVTQDSYLIELLLLIK